MSSYANYFITTSSAVLQRDSEIDGITETVNDIDLRQRTSKIRRCLGFGNLAPNTATRSAVFNGTVPFTVQSSAVADQHGSESLLIDVGDTGVIGELTESEFNIKRLIIKDSTANTGTFYFRLTWGSGTFAEAIAAGQFAGTYVTFGSPITPYSVNAVFCIGTVFESGVTKLWLNCKSDVTSKFIDFFLDLGGLTTVIEAS